MHNTLKLHMAWDHTQSVYLKFVPLKEYLVDYASEETRAAGEALIEKELGNIPKEKVRKIAEEYIREIENGKRDFRF